MGDNMKKKMAEYQNALEEMSSEAVEYVRGILLSRHLDSQYFRSRDSGILSRNMRSGLYLTQRI